MATLNSIVYNIASAMEREKDPEYVERVRFSVIYYGPMFIRRDQEKNKLLPVKSIQPIVVEMAKINASELPDVTVGAEVYRSKEPLPWAVRLKTRDAVDYVGSVDKSEPYSLISAREAGLMEHNKFSKSLPRYYFMNGFLYLKNVSPSKVLVEAAWENPTTLERFLKTDGTLAYTEEMEYPLPDDMIQGITLGLLSGELKLVGDGQPNEVQIDG